MGDCRRLKVWRVAHQSALAVYEATRAFPASELYGLTSKLRRSVASIPANLAEGCGRDTDPELARFARIALGSANEAEYHLLLPRDLGYLSRQEHGEMAETLRRIKNMLAKLVNAVVSDSRRPTADSR